MKKGNENSVDKSSNGFEIFKKNGEAFMAFVHLINDVELSSSARILFQRVYQYAARTGYCYMDNHGLCEDAGLNASAVKSSLNELRVNGWIRSEMVPYSMGHRRKIRVMYHTVRKHCPRPLEYQTNNLGEFIGFAKDRKDKFHPNAIATYVLHKKYRQVCMSLKPILFDKRLKSRARVLFQIISSLSAIKGYCYAGNTFLGERLGVKKGSVSEYISQLVKEGLITTEFVEYNSRRSRRIRLNFDELKKRYLKKENRDK